MSTTISTPSTWIIDITTNRGEVVPTPAQPNHRFPYGTPFKNFRMVLSNVEYVPGGDDDEDSEDEHEEEEIASFSFRQRYQYIHTASEPYTYSGLCNRVVLNNHTPEHTDAQVAELFLVELQRPRHNYIQGRDHLISILRVLAGKHRPQDESSSSSSGSSRCICSDGRSVKRSATWELDDDDEDIRLDPERYIECAKRLKTRAEGFLKKQKEMDLLVHTQIPIVLG